MTSSKHRKFVSGLALVAAAGALLGGGRLTLAGGMPNTFVRSFAFPVSFANGVTGDLVFPAGSASKLSFDSGKVAIGELPVPMPLQASRRGRARSAPQFVRSSAAGPYARLMLNGVVDVAGPVNNTGNQFVIDAVVSPSGATITPPPYVIPFDINNGSGFVDVPLPIENQTDAPVRVQVLGVSVIDPEGQPFGVLGFELPPARQTPTPRATATPGGTPPIDGVCFVGPNCAGASFPSSQERCCNPVARPDVLPSVSSSWCPRDKIDPSTGRCSDEACVACMPPSPLPDCGDRPTCMGPCTIQCPDGGVRGGVCHTGAGCQCSASCEEPTQPPAPCADAANCSGPCVVRCADGTTVGGKCASDQADRCECSATCTAPTPCSPGQCFDTITGQCTGHPCGQSTQCPLPNQLCDMSGRRCPCEPPPPPHGGICCQCTDPMQMCFDLRFVEVQPICPPGCQTFPGQECDHSTGNCVPPMPCGSDKDCDDGNGCTIDRCTSDGCTHDCVCLGPMGCGPGPGHRQ